VVTAVSSALFSCGQGSGPSDAASGGLANAGGKAGGGSNSNGGNLATGGQGAASGGREAAGGSEAQGGRQADGGAGFAGDSTRSGGTAAIGGQPGSDGVGAGCGKAPPESGRKTLDVNGEAREYILKVPDDYSPAHPYRLIFGYHGRMYDADWVANGEPPLTGPYFGLEQEAQGSAIFVATQALSTSWNNQDGRDIAYTEALVATLSDELCIDSDRIFATGFSYGALMTIRIGCELAGTFRAIAPMSGSLGNGCPENEEQVAYWASHGLQDTTILPSQGEEARDEFIARNHCSSESEPSAPAGCVSYLDCDPGYPVSFCTFEGEHEPAPFAGTAIWTFFSQF